MSSPKRSPHRKSDNGTELSIPRSAFRRLVVEIAQEYKRDLRYQADAIEALQTASEDYLQTLFMNANDCTTHADRDTLTPSDIQLAKILMGPHSRLDVTSYT
jgi:histone H3